MKTPLFFYLTELLFPRLCVVCGDKLIEQEQLICLHCLHHIPRTNFHRNPDNPVAQLFYGRVQIEFATAFYAFSKGSPYQKLLHNLKYKGMKELGEEVGKQFGIDLLQSPEFSSVDLICPVPLHPQKEKKRGYNQSWWIASGIAKQMNKELLIALENNNTVSVDFATKIGHIRIMKCTRNLDEIPEGDHQGINTVKLNGPDICCVYDWLVADWRAFRWDSVLNWKIVK